MSSKKDEYISDAVIGRLPRYYRYLGDLLDNHVTRISSGALAERMGLTASQVRQDFNHFGGFGHQGYGYNVEMLRSEIASILGIDHIHNIIIVGAGHLGSALVNYSNFSKRNFKIQALFDVDPKVIGTEIASVKVYSIDELESYIPRHNIDIAVLTIPKSQAAEMGERLCQTGIRGIWNFASMDLPLSNPDVIVENVHLSDSIMRLSYRLHNEKNSAN